MVVQVVMLVLVQHRGDDAAQVEQGLLVWGAGLAVGAGGSGGDRIRRSGGRNRRHLLAQRRQPLLRRDLVARQTLHRVLVLAFLALQRLSEIKEKKMALNIDRS